uniref:TIM-barrel fold metal-dependent hydrolase n=1 Tax=Uncultured bacterium HF130_AEPn_1 TaxID=663362 RepID=D0E8I0_UNCHF|nr:TIM-barrel fold metal-dependent hydrolase [uncultured bacterium HF130_AEPn_1]
MNLIYGCGDNNAGGKFNVDKDSTLDKAKACKELSGNEFIFDVQTHHVNPGGDWRKDSKGWESFLSYLPQGFCGEKDRVDCYDPSHYIREVFLNSDTSMAVLSAVPALPGKNPLEIEDAVATRRLLERLSDTERLILHGLVMPNLGTEQLESMDSLVEKNKISAWKVYTPFGGWRLDDEKVGIPFIEKAKKTGVKVICAHKGFPLQGFDPKYAAPDDIGTVAKAYPELTFIIYHSAYEGNVKEGPYDPDGKGVDRLIRTLLDNGIAKSSNVYAELGSTWRSLMTKPDEAAHVIGKLIKYLGEDNVVWGTDSIWYGSPQDQIKAFRAFEISESFQEKYAYKKLDERLKQKILGLNAAKAYGVDPNKKRCAIKEDELAKMKASRPEIDIPSFRKYGPRTRREFMDFLKLRDFIPG